MRRAGMERLIGGLVVVLAAAGFALALRQLVHLPPQRDFDAYYTAARAANAGLSLYAPAPDSIMGAGALPSPHREYVYPPLLAGLLRPLALVPYRAASLVWLGLNIAALGVLLTVLERLSPAVRSHRRLVLIALLFFPATYITWLEGQISIVLAAMIVYAAAAARSHAHGRWTEEKAGVALGLAGALKVYPIVLIPIFALHRRWRVVTTAVITGIAATVLGILLAGNLQDALYWFTHVLRAVGERAWPANQSLAAVLERLAPAEALRGVWTGTESLTVPLHALLPSRDAAAALSHLGQAALIIGTAWALWRRRSFGGSNALARDMALGVTLMSLVVPVVWDHYYLQLLVPMALLWEASATDTFSRRALLASVLFVVLQRYWRLLLAYVAPTGLLLGFGFLGVVMLYVAALRLCARAEYGDARPLDAASSPVGG